MRRIVTISFTPLDASGGVPRWNRDFKSGFPEGAVTHYSWWDALPAVGGKDDHNVPEWDKARVLNQYLIWSKKISKDDIIIVDGFWGLGLEEFPNVISVAHGIWSHQTLEDVEQGKLPDFPLHHSVQVDYRKKHVARGGKIVSVSDFIATEIRKQWSLPSFVINNAIDLSVFSSDLRLQNWCDEKLVIHGVNDPGNENKGWKHVKHLIDSPFDFPADILSLDEAHKKYKFKSKPEALANADLVVIPSAYEGNSYFCLEALASNVPVIAYNVGLMYKAWGSRDCLDVGTILDRSLRSPEVTRNAVSSFLKEPHEVNPRRWVSQFSVDNFHEEWRQYLAREFGWVAS